MSLINELLCDLQERKRSPSASDPLADLPPVRRARVGARRSLPAAAAALLVASSAFAYWSIEEGSIEEASIEEASIEKRSIEETGSKEEAAPRGAAPIVSAQAAGLAATHRPLVTREPDQRWATLSRFKTSLAERGTREPLLPPAPKPVTTSPQPATAAPVVQLTGARRIAVATAAGQPEVARTPAKVIVADARREGLQALAAGRPADAEAKFRLRVAQRPEEAQAWLNLTRALAAQGREDDAVAALSAALVAVQQTAPVARQLARRLLKRGATHEALKLLEAYRPKGPLNPEHDAFIAALQQRLGRHDVAAERYRGVLAVRPEAATWWVGLAISEEARGNGEQALDAYRHARNIGHLDARLAAYTDQRIDAILGTDQS